MKSRQPGFTIIELMVTVLVLSILFGAAVPSFREFTRNNRIVATQNDLITAMNLARSEAIRRSRNVTVCPSSDGVACTATTNWGGGWIVSAAGQVLQVWPAPGGAISTTADVQSITYEPVGTVTNASVFTVTASGCKGRHKHVITVRIAGTPQSTTLSCT